jgi:hypothetical protein
MWRQVGSPKLRALINSCRSELSMSKKSNAQSGRIAYDESGQPVWEWRVDTGVFTRDVDTRKMRTVERDAASSLKSVPPEQARRFVGFDPYSTAVAKESPAPAPKPEPSEPKAPKTRRTLDDMRALSEEIKKNRLKK